MKKKKYIETSNNQKYYHGVVAGTLVLAFIAMIYKLSQNSSEELTNSNALVKEGQALHSLILQSHDILFSEIDTFQLVECESRINNFRKNSLLPTWLKSYTVKVDPRVNDIEINIENAKQLCKQAFQQIIAEDSFFPNLFPTVLSNLEIILITANTAHNKDSIGIYSLKHNQIGIVYRADSSIQDYKKALKNEFFAHQVAARNLNNRISLQGSDNGTSIFLKKDGHIDEAAQQKFELIFQSIKQSVEDYKKLLSQSPTHEKNKRDVLIQLAKDYFPKKFYLDKEEFDLAVKFSIITEPDANGFFGPGVNSPKNLPFSYGRKEKNKISYSHCKDESLESKAVALFADITMQLNALESKNGPYFKKNKAAKLNEFASSMSELPTSIQKHLFPDYYKFMCEFFSNNQEFYQKGFTEPDEKKVFSASENHKPTLFKSAPQQQPIHKNHNNHQHFQPR